MGMKHGIVKRDVIVELYSWYDKIGKTCRCEDKDEIFVCALYVSSRPNETTTSQVSISAAAACSGESSGIRSI
jgi:hypothetical protein